MITKEVIDDFLADNEQIKQNIKRISENFFLSDFVKVTEEVRDYLQNRDSSATKHFSLIEHLEGFAYVLSAYEFYIEFEKVLELFIFRYRAIYTSERLYLYMRREVKNKVISNLVDV